MEKRAEVAERIEQLKQEHLDPTLRKLMAGYEMRTYWFELFECARKILLVGMPVFFEVGSVEQLAYGLIVCFISFGAFALLRPYASDMDDQLAQLCQMQIFFSLVSSIILKYDRAREGGGSQNLDYLLCTLTFIPLMFGFVVHVLDEGLYDAWVVPTKEWVKKTRVWRWLLVKFRLVVCTCSMRGICMRLSSSPRIAP